VKQTTIGIAMVVLLMGCTSPTQGTDSTALSSFFGFDGGEQKAARDFAIQQKAVRRCMKMEGFEYAVPKRLPTPGLVRPPVGEEVAWRKRHGYGVAESIAGMTKEKLSELANTDPNEKFRNKLNPEARRAYDKALIGVEKIEPGTLLQGGCSAKALVSTKSLVKIRRAQDSYSSYFSSALREPKVLSILAPWSRCMRKSGFKFNMPEEVYTSILNPEMERLLGSGPPSSSESGSIVIDVRPLEASDVRKLRSLEQEIAEVDNKCMGQADIDKLNALIEDSRNAYIKGKFSELSALKAEIEKEG
jgi:hypothetical protein